MLHQIAIAAVLLLIVLLSVGGAVGVAFLFIRSIDQSLGKVLSYLSTSRDVGGQPLSMLEARQKLEADKLDFEREKQRMVIQQALGSRRHPGETGAE
jgi:hypothetical protein